MKNLISVIIPLYNKENSIKKTIESVLRQTDLNFELLIVNDGSTDNGVEVISQFADNRIVVYSKENGGVSSARNYGIKKAKGEYIFFLDADDLITSNCLEVFNQLVIKYPDEFVFTSNFYVSLEDEKKMSFCSEKEEKVIQNPFKEIWHRKIFPRTGALLIKKECFYNNFFNTNITVYEDLDLILRLVKLYKVVYTPQVLLFYETENNFLSKNTFPISGEFAYYIELKNTTFYERLLLSENIINAYIKRIKLNDTQAKKYLFQKIKTHIVFLMFTIIYKKTFKILKKLKIFI